MSKNLVIVESPAKAKTLSRYLGKEYEVKASMGPRKSWELTWKKISSRNTK